MELKTYDAREVTPTAGGHMRWPNCAIYLTRLHFRSSSRHARATMLKPVCSN